MILRAFMLFKSSQWVTRGGADFSIIVILLSFSPFLHHLVTWFVYLISPVFFSRLRSLFRCVVFIYAVLFVAIKIQWPWDEHHYSKEDRNIFLLHLSSNHRGVSCKSKEIRRTRARITEVLGTWVPNFIVLFH